MISRLVTIFLLVAISGPVYAEEISTKVSGVVVYPQGATITREGSVSLDQGTTELLFVGLVDNIDPARLRIEVDQPGIEIGQVRFLLVQREEAYDAEVRRLEDAIFSVQSEIRAVIDSTKTAELQLRYLNGIAEGYAKESWFAGGLGSADTSSWRGALTALDEGANRAHQRIRNDIAERRDLSQRLSKLERESRDLSGGSLASQTVSVTVVTSTAQNARFRLRYYQEEASWNPLYEARLDSESGSLQLVQQALVRQSTDEEWRNVRLTLSTSEPTGDLVRPGLNSEFLAIRPDLRARSRPSLAFENIEEVIVTARRSNFDFSKVSNYAVNYPVPGLVTMTNDRSDEQTYNLTSLQFATELVTQIVPRKSTDAFLAVRFTYDDALPLYGSMMRVYVDGVYVGVSEMPTVLPQSEVNLPMGQDRRVEVSVVNQGGKQGEKGILGRRKQENTDYLFTVTNRRGTATNVEVFDLYPVSRDKSIEVSVPKTATVPSDENLSDQPGLVVWRKELEGGEEWRIRHQYQVSYPADKAIMRQ